MIKRLVPLTLLMGLAIQAATITATTPQTSYKVGDSVLVNISVSDVMDLRAFFFDVSFKPSVLAAQSVTEGPFFASIGAQFEPGTIDNTAGTISSNLLGIPTDVPGFSGSALVGTATFTAIGAGTTDVSLLNVILLNSELNRIPATSVPVSISVLAGTATPEPGSLGLLTCALCATLIALRSWRVQKLRS